MSLSERSAREDLEAQSGPSVTNTAMCNSSLPTGASVRRVHLIRGSNGVMVPDDMRLLLAAVLANAEADREFGRPLGYRDPTGDSATFNTLVSTLGSRGRS